MLEICNACGYSYVEWDPSISFDTLKSFIAENKIEGLMVFELKWGVHDLAFLADLPGLKYLSLGIIGTHEYNFLSNLVDLECLSIISHAKQGFDVSSCLKLKDFQLNWVSGIRGLDKLTNLRHMDIWNFSGRSIDLIPEIRSLTSLILRNPKLKNLDGIGRFPALQSLSLGPDRYLESISGLLKLSDLRQLSFDGCRKISDITKVGDIPALEAIELTDCGKLETIKFLEGLVKLKALVVTGDTDIKDGDLRHASTLDNFIINPRRHYDSQIEIRGFINPKNTFMNYRAESV
jgi:internalin A